MIAHGRFGRQGRCKGPDNGLPCRDTVPPKVGHIQQLPKNGSQMRAIIPEFLWIGNAHDARLVAEVLLLGVRAVVDLAANEAPLQYPRDIVYCRLPLNDGAGNEPAILRLAVRATAEFLEARMPTLVTCSSGMSRSPAIVAAAIAVVEQHDIDEVLRRIAAAGPHDVDAGLWLEIKRVCFALG